MQSTPQRDLGATVKIWTPNLVMLGHHDVSAELWHRFEQWCQHQFL